VSLLQNCSLLSAVVKIPWHCHHFPWLSMTFAIFHDFPGLENGLPKFHDFPWPGGTLFACLLAPAVTTTYIILSSNKIQNGDILVWAYLGCSGKWPLNKCRVVSYLSSLPSSKSSFTSASKITPQPRNKR